MSPHNGSLSGLSECDALSSVDSPNKPNLISKLNVAYRYSHLRSSQYHLHVRSLLIGCIDELFIGAVFSVACQKFSKQPR